MLRGVAGSLERPRPGRRLPRRGPACRSSRGRASSGAGRLPRPGSATRASPFWSYAGPPPPAPGTGSMPSSTAWPCSGAALRARGPASSNRRLHEQQEPPPSAPGTGSMPSSTAWLCGAAALRGRDRLRRTAASTSSPGAAALSALRGCARTGAAPPGPAPPPPGPRGGTGSSSASKRMRTAAFKAARGRRRPAGPGRAASALAGRRVFAVSGPQRFPARNTDPTGAGHPDGCDSAALVRTRVAVVGPRSTAWTAFRPLRRRLRACYALAPVGRPRPGARGGSAQDVPAAGARASVAPGETASHQRRWRRRAGPDGGSACMGCADAWQVIRLCVFRRSLEVERATDLTCSGR